VFQFFTIVTGIQNLRQSSIVKERGVTTFINSSCANIRRAVAGFCVLAVACAASAARAENSQITVDLANLSPPIRSDSPMTVVWRIVSQSGNLIDGRLVITVFDNGKMLGQAEDDVVLQSGEQFVRTVLPPIEASHQNSPLDVKVELFSQKKEKLGVWYPRVPTMPAKYERKQVVLVSDPWQSTLPEGVNPLLDHLRIENWNDNKRDDPNDKTVDKTISTNRALMRPGDLPADSLGYCGFDIVVLVQDGFSELTEGRLRPLLEWVAAGGSLFIAPGNVVLKDFHVAALNQFARAAPGEPVFVVDGTGRLIDSDVAEGGAAPVLHKRLGLGRVAILRGKLRPFVETRERDLRATLAFLWKMRHDRLAHFLETGQFNVTTTFPQDQVDPNEMQYRRYPQGGAAEYARLRPRDMQLAPIPLQTGDELVTRLMPEGIQVVPLPLVGLILVVYVVLIGPTDWLVLGAIRRRKWTWITFPFVTVAITLLTVWLAEWYMHISDRHRTVTFHDVGIDGQIARKNQFEVLFQGSERVVTTELNRELFADMELRRFSSATSYNIQQQQSQGIDQRRRNEDVAQFEGRVPSYYKVNQYLSQWTPQLNRRFTILHPSDKPADFPWDKYADADTYRPATLVNGPARQTLLNDVTQTFGGGAHLAVFVNGTRQILMGNFGFLQAGTVYGVDEYGNAMGQPQWYQPPNANQTQSSFLNDVSVNNRGALFSVISQLSPTGGRDFEDMALVDPSDPEQWLLVVAVERGDDVDIYRKLYRKGD
jgi:hypothetical protein